MTNQIIEFITLLTTGLTAGSAIYISLVVQPTWLKTNSKSAIENFAPIFHGSVFSQATFSTIAIIGGIVLGFLTNQNLWFLGSILMIFNIPFTLYILMPVNNILLGKKGDITNDQATTLFKKWGALQWIRTAIVCVTFVLFLWLVVFS